MRRSRRASNHSSRLRLEGGHRRRARQRFSPCPALPPRTPAPTPPTEAEVEELRRENAQLRQVLTGRPVVDQARGILMAVGACGPERAWEVLVSASQRTNIKLRRVAELVVAGTTGGQVPRPVAAQLRRSLERLPHT
ncbi:ANTAR domain-containing protein [Streptomyces longisporoflavus]|uniref:ANTAR domain-containing protein n=1 Tax=Streptomyces longisporoflavus TaxID=28044 RepID=UPI001E3A7A3D|nr:ANTAR domain-containing protein [Streptomyces longisporoflavus]